MGSNRQKMLVNVGCVELSEETSRIPSKLHAFQLLGIWLSMCWKKCTNRNAAGRVGVK